MTERVTSGVGHAVETGHAFTGQQLIDLELYAQGGAEDVHTTPAPDGGRALTLYLPGSSIWYMLELDTRDRIRSEVVVSPGHLIQRTFSYPD